MPADPLTLLEREEIRVGIDRGEPDRVIAGRLGRHRCTINAEINRHGGRAGYTAAGAHAATLADLARPKVALLLADPALAALVTERLNAKDSPMTIARELAGGVNGVTALVSHECIYQAIYAHGRRGLPKDVHKGLHRRRRCRKPRQRETPAPVVRGPLGAFNLIGLRPEIALARIEVGHLEGDLILGARNRSAIVTVVDRASRNLWLADLPDTHDADNTFAALHELIERIPHGLRRTLTWDQGREMARHHDLAATTGIDIYFANPHSPWERPSNEHTNGILRRYVGKGTNLHTYTPADLRRFEQRINTMPRRSLNWSTAHDLYTAAVAMTD